jgi:hypothetical protein
MITIYSKNNVSVRLTDERWAHIIRRHPEMKDQKGRVLETVENPDYILEGDYEELLAVRFFKETPLTQKFLVVIYKEVSEYDGFIVTAYFTRKPSTYRRIIWKR